MAAVNSSAGSNRPPENEVDEFGHRKADPVSVPPTYRCRQAAVAARPIFHHAAVRLRSGHAVRSLKLLRRVAVARSPLLCGRGPAPGAGVIMMGQHERAGPEGGETGEKRSTVGHQTSTRYGKQARSPDFDGWGRARMRARDRFRVVLAPVPDSVPHATTAARYEDQQRAAAHQPGAAVPKYRLGPADAVDAGGHPTSESQRRRWNNPAQAWCLRPRHPARRP